MSSPCIRWYVLFLQQLLCKEENGSLCLNVAQHKAEVIPTTHGPFPNAAVGASATVALRRAWSSFHGDGI